MKYPEIGEQIRVKDETGTHTVIQLWKPWRVQLDDGRIFLLDGIISNHQKYITLFVIQVYYGTWEDVTQEETLYEARQRRKEYRDNQDYPVRLIRRKELNDLWKGK